MSQRPAIDENASCILWKTSGNRRVWRGRNLAGAAWAGEDPDAPGLVLLWNLPGAGTLRMDFGRIEFHPCGEQPASTQPLPKDFFVQYPYLVCTQDVSSSVGLRTRVRILAEEGGATVDVELETIEPLDWVELAGRIRLEGVSLPGVTQGRLEQDRIRWCELVRQGATIGALLFDLGENGYADVATSELSVNWFRQPLEKGVILVGRFAVVIRSEESEEAFRERSQGWLERPTFL